MARKSVSKERVRKYQELRPKYERMGINRRFMQLI